MARVWTRQGVIDSTQTGEESFKKSLKELRWAFQQPSFVEDVDRQTQAIIWCQQWGRLGHPGVAEVVTDLGRALGHIPRLRFRYILELRDPTDIRAALARSHTRPRPLTFEENRYPVDGWLGTYLAYARESNVPIGFHFWCGAATLGAALRRNLYLPIGYNLYPNHYFFLIGDSGLGKSRAFAHSRPILERANELVVDELSEFVVGPDSTIPNLTVNILDDDLTPEKLIASLQPATIPARRTPGDADDLPLTLKGEDSVGVLWNDELISLAGKHKYGAAGLFHIITALYTCPPKWSRSTRAHDQETLVKPTLNFGTASTLEWINRSISEDMFEGGFMSRCVFCFREELGFEGLADDPEAGRYGIEPDMDPIAQHALAKMLVPWMVMQPRPATLTREAVKLWEESVLRFNDQIATAQDPRLKPYYERKKNHVGKVALTLLASRYTGDPEEFKIEEIQDHASLLMSADLLQQAIDIVEYEEQYLPECFSRIGQHKDASGMDKLRGFIAARNRLTKAPVQFQLVKRRATNIFGTDGLKILNVMVGMGTLGKRQVRRGDRGPKAPEFWDVGVLGVDPKRHWWEGEEILER